MADKHHGRSKAKPKSATSRQMQLIDKLAQERFNIHSIELMENAGEAAASCAMGILKGGGGSMRVAVFCGKGNNGGDGFVVSRKLIEERFEVDTFLLCAEDELRGDPAINLAALKKMGANITPLVMSGEAPALRKDYKLIIDAIFGTGFKGRPDEFVSSLIASINKSGAKILAIDVPSGLDATTGVRAGECVKADTTITFGLPKNGFYKEDGPQYTGDIIVKNIGFPETLLKDLPEDNSHI
ncbi:MAG: NAD(P)H-hydrate epimerase [Candidatus Omnitrophota bacterium]